MIRSIKKYFGNINFRKKLLISHAMVCIIPIIILGLFCYCQVYRLIMEREKENLSQFIEQACYMAESDLQYYGKMITYLSMHSQIKRYLKADYQNTPKDYYMQYEFYKNLLDPTMLNLEIQHDGLKGIRIYTENHMAYRSDLILSMEEVKKEAWVQESLKNKFIGWYREGNKNVRCVLAFQKMDKEKEALLTLNIDYQNLFSPFDKLNSDNYGIVITDKNHRVFFEYDTMDKRNKSRKLTKEELYSADRDRANPFNRNYLIMKKELATTGWQVYLYKPYSDIRASVSNISDGVIIFIFICILLLCIIIPILSGGVANRLERLTFCIQNINLSNLGEKIAGEEKDEVGILILNINKMLGRIQSLINEVYKTRLAKKGFELKALQAQINPHFLYNTLSLINCQAILVGQKEISELAQAISNFYRTALNKGKDIIEVENELENTKAYLYIQSVMHNNSFDVQFDIDEEVYKEKVINLILQPVVENAIEHGIDRKLDGERGFLYISAKNASGKLKFVVEDNGAGMKEEKVQTLLQNGTQGYGIKNVHERIQLFYGKEYGIRVYSQPDRGTRVEITLPLSGGK